MDDDRGRLGVLYIGARLHDLVRADEVLTVSIQIDEVICID